MSVWRPTKSILVKVIGLAQCEGHILAAEVLNDDGSVKGVRPIGGHVEFGESKEAALHREFMEELGTEIDITSSWRMFENMYTHEGAIGHEIILCASVGLQNEALYQQERLVFSEDSGAESVARWFSVLDCKQNKVNLFPTGLIDIL